MRTIVHRAVAILSIASVSSGCGPIRLDNRPQIRGTIAAASDKWLSIRHKTGQVYHVELTQQTRIVNQGAPGPETPCAGQRATVFLVGPGHFIASAVTIWGGQCR